MADKNYNPNARFDTGPNTAGSGKQSTEPTLLVSSAKGVAADGTVVNANIRTGFNAAGLPRNNAGGNVAGAPRGYNGT